MNDVESMILFLFSQAFRSATCFSFINFQLCFMNHAFVVLGSYLSIDYSSLICELEPLNSLTFAALSLAESNVTQSYIDRVQHEYLKSDRKHANFSFNELFFNDNYDTEQLTWTETSTKLINSACSFFEAETKANGKSDSALPLSCSIIEKLQSTTVCRNFGQPRESGLQRSRHDHPSHLYETVKNRNCQIYDDKDILLFDLNQYNTVAFPIFDRLQAITNRNIETDIAFLVLYKAILKLYYIESQVHNIYNELIDHDTYIKLLNSLLKSDRQTSENNKTSFIPGWETVSILSLIEHTGKHTASFQKQIIDGESYINPDDNEFRQRKQNDTSSRFFSLNTVHTVFSKFKNLTTLNNKLTTMLLPSSLIIRKQRIDEWLSDIYYSLFFPGSKITRVKLQTLLDQIRKEIKVYRFYLSRFNRAFNITEDSLYSAVNNMIDTPASYIKSVSSFIEEVIKPLTERYINGATSSNYSIFYYLQLVLQNVISNYQVPTVESLVKTPVSHMAEFKPMIVIDINSQCEVAVIVRGTISWHEWLVDFDTWQIEDPILTGVRSHRGVSTLSLNIIATLVNQVKTSLQSRNCKELNNIVFTGHSLGASLALQLALYYSYITEYNVKPVAVVFSPLRQFNIKLPKVHRDKITSIIMIDDNDPLLSLPCDHIPRCSFATMKGYGTDKYASHDITFRYTTAYNSSSHDISQRGAFSNLTNLLFRRNSSINSLSSNPVMVDLIVAVHQCSIVCELSKHCKNGNWLCDDCISNIHAS